MTTTHTAEALDELEDVDTTEGTLDEPETGEPEAAGENKAPLRPNRLVALVVAAALVLTGLGAWFTIEANQLRTSNAATNKALVNTEASAEVTAAVTNALNQIFSYSFDSLERTEQAAKRVLRGQAREGYLSLFNRIRALAPQQEMVVTSRVVKSAVTYLSDGKARMVVFLDQTAKRAGQDSPAAAAAQLTVTAKRAGETWVITKLVPH